MWGLCLVHAGCPLQGDCGGWLSHLHSYLRADIYLDICPLCFDRWTFYKILFHCAIRIIILEASDWSFFSVQSLTWHFSFLLEEPNSTCWYSLLNQSGLARFCCSNPQITVASMTKDYLLLLLHIDGLYSTLLPRDPSWRKLPICFYRGSG